MTDALNNVYKQLDQQWQQASEYGDTSYGACLQRSIEAARLWIQRFYDDIAHDAWLAPEIRHNDCACVFEWQRKPKTFIVYVDRDSYANRDVVEMYREYTLSNVCHSDLVQQDETKDIDATDVEAMRTAWQWLYSPYRFAVGDAVEVIQYSKEYRHALTGKQGVIAAHSIHDFVIPAYEVKIEGETGPYGYPYVALSERSLMFLDK